MKPKHVGLTTAPNGTWVQVERAAMERWSKLAVSNPRAAAVMMLMTSQMGRNNALVASQATLAKMAGCGLNTLKRALSVLREATGSKFDRSAPQARLVLTSLMTEWLGPETAMVSATACFLPLCCSQTTNNPIRPKLAHSRLYRPFRPVSGRESSYLPAPAYHHHLSLLSTAWNQTCRPPKNRSPDTKRTLPFGQRISALSDAPGLRRLSFP